MSIHVEMNLILIIILHVVYTWILTSLYIISSTHQHALFTCGCNHQNSIFKKYCLMMWSFRNCPFLRETCLPIPGELSRRSGQTTCSSLYKPSKWGCIKRNNSTSISPKELGWSSQTGLDFIPGNKHLSIHSISTITYKEL